MGRWGEEESKSRGLVGFFIWGLVTLAFVYTFYKNYENLEGRRILEKQMQSIVRTASMHDTEEQVVAKVIDAAEEMGVTLDVDNVSMVKSDDGYGNFIWKADIDFPVKVNLFITEFDFNLPIREEVTLIY